MASEKLLFDLYTLNRRWFNTTLLRRRGFDGHIVTMQQSGSHWLKNMLSQVLISLYGLPQTAHIQDDSIIGHPKSKPRYQNIPQIVNSHGYPHALTLKIPLLHYPRYLVLVRNLRESLVSHYERFKPDYPGVDWDTYLRGDVRQKRFHSDIFTRIRFMNEWGRLLGNEKKISFVRYEDMKTDPAAALDKVCGFLGIVGVTPQILAQTAAATSKEKMAEKPNPEITTTVIRLESKPLEHYFTPENQAFFENTCRKHLRHDFGYGYL